MIATLLLLGAFHGLNPAMGWLFAVALGLQEGRRVYLTNSLYAAWDEQFYPEGIDGWMVKLDAPEGGGLEVDPGVYVEFHGERPHQVRLQGGDASSDSYCFP